MVCSSNSVMEKMNWGGQGGSLTVSQTKSTVELRSEIGGHQVFTINEERDAVPGATESISGFRKERSRRSRVRIAKYSITLYSERVHLPDFRHYGGIVLFIVL